MTYIKLIDNIDITYACLYMYIYTYSPLKYIKTSINFDHSSLVKESPNICLFGKTLQGGPKNHI